MHRFVARRPVLDRNEKVYGYDFLFRAGEEEIWPLLASGDSEENSAAAPLGLEGLDDLLDGARPFIRCSRQALASGQAARLLPDQVILQIPAIREPDNEIIAACRRLKLSGFPLALDDFEGTGDEPLAGMADIIELDITASTDRAQWLLIRKLRPKGTVFVAKKVEKRAQFQAAIQQGFTYFQGSFYLRPQAFEAHDVTPSKLVYLLVLSAVTRPEINMQEVANTIKHDLALSYKLLRFLNSARFSFHSRVKSIQHALLLLGQNEIRKWIGLISVTALGEGGPSILVKTALIRAAFCEGLAPLINAPNRQSDYFFLGLLSSIDILMRRPMRAVLAELPITPDVSAALMGEHNPLRTVLDAVISYELGNWEECATLAEKLGLTEETLGKHYLRALGWSRELTQEGKKETVEVNP